MLVKSKGQKMIIEINEQELPILTLATPSGERPDEYFEGYVGALPTPTAAMPDDVDVDATVFIKFK